MKLQINIEGKAYEVDVETVSSNGDARRTPVRPPATPPRARTAKPPRSRARGQQDHDPLKECRSPLLGFVARVCVAPGQRVSAGDLLFVLEAMKMETNVAAPADCTIKTVSVAVGAPVKPGVLLAEFA